MSAAEVLANQRPWWIAVGDALEQLRLLPDACVHCCVTSPPYFGLRDYGVAGQIGLEPTLEAYVAALVAVFREVKRVLHPSGVVFVNLGDSYYSDPGNGRGGGSTLSGGQPHLSGSARRAGVYGTSGKALGDSTGRGSSSRSLLKPKDLLMAPATVALALRADGWYLRSAITWIKTACMPESVTDRPTSATEQIYLLSKRAGYYYDAAAIRQEPTPLSFARHGGGIEEPYQGHAYSEGRHGHRPHEGNLAQNGRYTDGHNLRNAWILGPEPYADAHFAVFPTEIPRRAILAATSAHGVCRACGHPWRRVTERTRNGTALPLTGKNGALYVDGTHGSAEARTWNQLGPGIERTSATLGWAPTCRCDADVVPALVLDPFAGSGTTLVVAQRLGRRALGIELSPAYAAMARRRIVADQGVLPAHVAEVAGAAQLRLPEAGG